MIAGVCESVCFSDSRGMCVVGTGLDFVVDGVKCARRCVGALTYVFV